MATGQASGLSSEQALFTHKPLRHWSASLALHVTPSQSRVRITGTVVSPVIAKVTARCATTLPKRSSLITTR